MNGSCNLDMSLIIVRRDQYAAMSVILMTQSEHYKPSTEVPRYTKDKFVSFYLYETTKSVTVFFFQFAS